MGEGLSLVGFSWLGLWGWDGCWYDVIDFFGRLKFGVGEKGRLELIKGE